MKPVGDLKTQSGAYAIGLDDKGIIVTIPDGYRLLVRTEDKRARLDITPLGPLPNEDHVRSFRVEPVKVNAPKTERTVNLDAYVPESTRAKWMRRMWWVAITAALFTSAYNAWSHFSWLLLTTFLCVVSLIATPPKVIRR
jgi:hypothetical protein